MKLIALVSGGKDSILALLMAYRFHHEPVVLANIAPCSNLQAENNHEADSYMYQTVGHEALDNLAHCLDLPLRRGYVSKHTALDQTLNYSEQRYLRESSESSTPSDEVEQLYQLLKVVKEEFPEVEGVTSGAILSNYQRYRVENVCERLGLTSVAYLWQRQASEILDMAAALRVEAILIKTASAGLIPQKLLGKSLGAARSTLEMMAVRFGGNIAGEGGEFESLVLDAPLFRKERLVVDSLEVVMIDENPFSPSGHAIVATRREVKTEDEVIMGLKLLGDLREGVFRFDSDDMPCLPETVPPFPIADKCFENRSNCVDIPSFMLPEVRVDELCLKHSEVCGFTADSSLRVPLQTCLTSSKKWAEEINAFPVYFVAQVPAPKDFDSSVTTELLKSELVKEYKQLISTVQPPGFTVLFSDKDDGVFQLHSLYARAGAEVKVVCNQSLSCWAESGYKRGGSQAREISYSTKIVTEKGSTDSSDDEKEEVRKHYVIAGGFAGTQPVTGSLATADALRACQCRGFSMDTEADQVAAQLAYACASASQYGSLYGMHLKTASRITVILDRTKEKYRSSIPLWVEWCLGLLAVPHAVEIEVIIGNLGGAQLLELLMEWKN